MTELGAAPPPMRQNDYPDPRRAATTSRETTVARSLLDIPRGYAEAMVTVVKPCPGRSTAQARPPDQPHPPHRIHS